MQHSGEWKKRPRAGSVGGKAGEAEESEQAGPGSLVKHFCHSMFAQVMHRTFACMFHDHFSIQFIYLL